MPQHKRGPWSQTEDSYLLSLVQMHGAHNWVRISQAIQTRSPKQCRERFHQNLKPSLNHEPITPEEGALIEQMVNEMGKRWAEIARRLRGRSDNAVKNWWNGGMNRRRRSNNPRRTALEFRAPQPLAPPAQISAAPALQPQQSHLHQQQPLPTNFPPSAIQQPFFNMPAQIFHPQMGGMPAQAMRIPPNNPAFRNGLIETPLPSPSAYSQMSAEGAPPSLISDSSSISARSPHNGASPIELPPLSGSRSERRQSSAPMLQLGVPGSFVQETEFTMADKQGGGTRMSLQQAFNPMPQQQHPAFLAPAHYIHPQQQQQHHHQQRHQYHPHPQQQGQTLPMAIAQASANRAQMQYMMPHQHQQPQHHQHQQMHRPPPPPQHLLPSQPAVQLPGITGQPSNAASGSGMSTPTNGRDDDARETPGPMAVPSSPDGSPKDKMRLSNLTH